MQWITPDWPAPLHVRAASTTRAGGVSVGAYRSLNLADHVGDRPEAVQRNRALLREGLALPNDPRWLQQVHGRTVVQTEGGATGSQADGSSTDRPGLVCAVLTADCLPVLLCDRRGERVVAVHAGWRGLAGGVIEAGLDALQCPGGDVLAWLGPCIGQQAFAVGGEVRAAFLSEHPEAESAFRPSQPNHWLADLAKLARLRLKRRGVYALFGGHWCTYSDSQGFFSYRREGVTGRMASLIWLQGQ